LVVAFDMHKICLKDEATKRSSLLPSTQPLKPKDCTSIHETDFSLITAWDRKSPMALGAFLTALQHLCGQKTSGNPHLP